LNIQAAIKKKSGKVEKMLYFLLPKENGYPRELNQAMRYAVLSGGKRLRPIFMLGACEIVGGKETQVLEAACALEFIHSYSLVHDDLPCMDNDTVRRGKPSCHAKFGEVTALLAGDALLTYGFKVLSRTSSVKSPLYKERRLQVIEWVADAIGNDGMVGGQALDMEFQEKEPDLPTLEYINTHKSGALIAVCVRAGAYLGGGTPNQVKSLYRYGKYIGLLFQIVDDIMDKQGYTRVMGVRESQKEAASLLAKAKRELLPFGKKGRFLEAIANIVATRKD
jgi:geranylgeranyl diphosphate synthase type II